jgi:nitrogen fixation protein NifB
VTGVQTCALPISLSWFAHYRQRIAHGELRHVPRGDAAIRQGALTGAAEAA